MIDGNKGSIIHADGMLYCYNENTGDVAIVRPSPKGFDIVSTFGVTEGSRPTLDPSGNIRRPAIYPPRRRPYGLRYKKQIAPAYGKN